MIVSFDMFQITERRVQIIAWNWVCVITTIKLQKSILSLFSKIDENIWIHSDFDFIRLNTFRSTQHYRFRDSQNFHFKHHASHRYRNFKFYRMRVRISFICNVIVSRRSRNLHVDCKCFVDVDNVALNDNSCLSSGFRNWIDCLLLHHANVSLSEFELDHITLRFTKKVSFFITEFIDFSLLFYNFILVIYISNSFSITFISSFKRRNTKFELLEVT